MLRRSLAALLVALAPSGAFAETATSTVQNVNTPQATVSQQTGGGVNFNQQYNNQWDNHNGFAPGVYCRTPTFYVGAGNGYASNWADESSTNTNHVTVSAGVLVPFGSSVLGDCAKMAKALTERAATANEVALVRACFELKRDGIVIDPVKFPALARCSS